ncbi:phasin [Caballeronia temeraria]|uniref:Phasin n=1 Tax=Caballeronia temeraria TaxID=1777137 RepID=A0A158DR06_9BURK|nr:phasin family protein [Caballeronia temeraria]SAK97028.1 phasin [Caballeronia temeraria]
MESTNQSSLLGEYSKLIKQFKLPAFDANAVFESRRKDVEALANASTIALTGIQSLGQKQMDILSGTMTRVHALFGKQAAEESKPAAGEAMQQAFRAAMSDMRELAGAAYRVPADTATVISKRVVENVEEIRALLQPRK